MLATVISRGLFMVEALYRRLPVGDFWHPAIGALGFATVGLFVPRVLGVGYDAIGDVLDSRIAVGTAAALAVGKLVAWWLALGSGTSGGTLVPILLISVSFGTVVGAAARFVGICTRSDLLQVRRDQLELERVQSGARWRRRARASSGPSSTGPLTGSTR